jgi:acyl-CoA reductase-like NAD-dependent aldehyde dehydrogenase
MTTVAPPPVDELTVGEPELDAAIAELAEGAAYWAGLNLAERAGLIAATHAAVAPQAEEWVKLAVAAKHIPDSPLVGEEWASGPFATLSGFGLMAKNLATMAAGKSSLDKLKVGTAPGGRVSLRVFPSDVYDLLVLNGFEGEVWMKPGVTLEQVKASAGLGARRIGENGGVGLVLGAGNISSIAPLDVLYELVANNRASILKLNPTFATLLPMYQQALAPLIDAGVLRIVNGGQAVGGYLAQHPGIDHVHITGSGVTHDAIVWGVGEEAERRRAANDPLLTKPITSELGGVAPVIVVPGQWSEKDLCFQAEHVVTMRMHNTGHNCVAAQVMIVSQEWPQRERFLQLIGEVLDEMPAREAWYPGTERRVDAAAEFYPGAERHGPGGHRLLIELDPDGPTDACTTEYFGPVLSHISLPGTGRAFLDAGITFANDKLAGTLGANVLIAPKDKRAMGAGFDEAIAELHYGTVAINVWTALAFLGAGMPWGAFPGHTLADVGSGIGVVHNAHLLDGTERAVVRGPFRPFPRSMLGGENSMAPKPPWFVTNRTEDVSSKRLTKFAAKPSFARLPGIFASAFRG